MPLGSKFVAAASGTVVNVGSNCTDNYGKKGADQADHSKFCNGGMGNYVVIKVDNSDMYIKYMHMTSVTVSKNQYVEAGQPIGTSGTTGRSTGPHAHFEVRIGGEYGTAIDPCGLFDSNYCND